MRLTKVSRIFFQTEDFCVVPDGLSPQDSPATIFGIRSFRACGLITFSAEGFLLISMVSLFDLFYLCRAQ